VVHEGGMWKLKGKGMNSGEERKRGHCFPILLFRIYVRRLQTYATASRSEIESGVHQVYRCDTDTFSLNAKSQ